MYVSLYQRQVVHLRAVSKQYVFQLISIALYSIKVIMQ